MNDVMKTIATRHNHDVRIILENLRNTEFESKDQIIDAVIDQAFQVELDRNETSERKRAAFRGWSRLVLAAARADDGGLDKLPWNEALKKILRAYLAVTESTNVSVDQVEARIRQVDAQAETMLAADDRLIAQLVSGVLRGSIELWQSDQPSEALKKKEIDGSQVVRADVMGAITGAAGAAVSTWWTGPVSGGAVAVAAGAGAVLGSATDAVLQDTAADAVEDAEPVENP